MEAASSIGVFALLFVYSLFFSMLKISAAIDTINATQSIRDGETLVSTGGSFELGFFSPAGSTSRYLGLWYKKSPQTVVWVANREVPISNKLGALNFTTQGILVLLNSTNNIVWSSNISTTDQNAVAQLLDSGNLVVRNGNDSDLENFLWQSFDYPCDTLLPGMKLGSNLATGLKTYLSSWKSTKDPAQGQFTLEIDIQGYPQLALRRGPHTEYRLGSWNGVQLTGLPGLQLDTRDAEFVINGNEVYFKYEFHKSSELSRFTLYPSGIVQRFTWSNETNAWLVFSIHETDFCERYAICGAYARCDIKKSPACSCLDGFKPKYPRDWDFGDWSSGCVLSTPVDCHDNDSFLNYTEIKLPDTSFSWFDKTIGLKECQIMCLKNCSCSAYANLDISGDGSGCLLWFGDLLDIRGLSDGSQYLYIRTTASELVLKEKKGALSKKKQAGIIAISVILGMGMLALGMMFFMRKRNLRNNDNCVERKDDMELPIFDLSTIAHATGNFSSSNKLGAGGFGPVFKGTLMEGQEIAVKRLSKSSSQGLNEFKNEVSLIAKLQHRNLVKLLGCCIDKDEKMLIYEFMPNRSLDFFIFDQTRRKLLDWGKRIKVIGGIARGLLYLHRDSRLRIIHRDIKASNILLDNESNPKISDFGLARMFGGDETEANTNRIVGTYGYMSPEYALDGHFSEKSDVFSFGVLVLEIVSGKKNRGFCLPDQNLNLLGHAWMLWIKGTPLDLNDGCLTELCNQAEVLRCIHVALLCVQQRAEDRPDMSTVVLMLSSENPLTQPKQPGFFMGRNQLEQDPSSNTHKAYSANEVTLSLLEAR